MLYSTSLIISSTATNAWLVGGRWVGLDNMYLRTYVYAKRGWGWMIIYM